jgi:dTDP-4-dehydrorhamnose 3,5-epimerase
LDFEPTSIPDAFLVRTTWFRDARGTFGRMFCAREFAEHGLESEIAQCNLSNNPRRGTLRGLHILSNPHEEAKLVQCVAGRIFDVAVDLRPKSRTFGRYFAAELSAGDGRLLYIPKGCAHGYQTLEDATSVLYHVSSFYEAAAERGVRWNDPQIAVPWPLPSEVILSDRDRNLPSFADYAAQLDNTIRTDGRHATHKA